MASTRGFDFKNRNFGGFFSSHQEVPKTFYGLWWPRLPHNLGLSTRQDGYKRRGLSGVIPRKERSPNRFLNVVAGVAHNVGEEFMQGDLQVLLDEAKSGIKAVGLVFEGAFVVRNQG